MTAELAVGVGAKELIPGDPDELTRLAARLSVFAEGMSDAAATLSNVEAAGWRGPAASAFKTLVGEQPAKYRSAGSSFGQAVGAIRAYAAVLRRAQAEAGRAASMFEDAKRESEQWQRARTSHDDAVRTAKAAGDPPPSAPAPPASDPAEAERVASQNLLADARSAVRAQGLIAASALTAAADDAPEEPGLLDSVIGGVGDFLGDVGDAASVWWKVKTAALEDAAGWVKDTWEGIGDTVHLVLDFAGFVPLLGAVPDVINAVIYVIEGDAENVAWSLGAAIPLAGDAAKGAKMIKEGVEVVAKKGDDAAAARVPRIEKAESPVWKKTQPFRGPIRTNGQSGKRREYYEWDHTHGDIEVYDRHGKHLGTRDPKSGEMVKPPDPGRTLDL